MTKRAEDWTEQELKATGGIVFERTYGEAIYGSGTLILKKIKRNADRWSLYAHLPAGMDLTPHVFTTGTIAECRAGFAAADATMRRRFERHAAERIAA